jgi:hypothetical protein
VYKRAFHTVREGVFGLKNVKNALVKPVGGAVAPWAMWIWNGVITESEIDRQLAALISAGFGGIAIRPGRDMFPVYMSQEFLDGFAHVCEVAHKHKVGVRLADDFSVIWPGGLDGLIGRSRKLQAEYLVFEREIAPAQGETEVEVAVDPAACYMAQAAKRSNKTLLTSDVRQVAVPAGKASFKWKSPGPEWRLLLYRKEPVLGPTGVGAPNVLNQKVVFTYMQEVLETLKSAVSKYVPTTFEGFITEVPALRPGGNAIYWDDDIAVKYKSRYKREFMNQLPALFLDTSSAERVRAQAHVFIANLIAERFAGPLDAWAKKYRLSQWLLWPETAVHKPAGALVDAFVPSEGAFPVVGLQNLDGSLENFALLRAAADVNANQYRRETVTVVGRNRTGAGGGLQDIKREVDMSLLAGPSKIIVDGVYFNTDQRNGYKAPCNPSWYSPEWAYAPLLCAYIARAQEMAAGGMHTSREVAVLHPATAIMGDYSPVAPTAAENGVARFRKTVDALCCYGKGFDVVTEDLLLTCMVRQNGEFATADRIRKGNYQALVVPYAPLVSRSLLVFLEKIATRGTTLVFIDEAPQGTYEDGITANVTLRIQKMTAPRRDNVSVIPPADLEHALASIKPEVAVMRESGESADVGVQVYHGEGGRMYLLHNILDSAEQNIVVDVQAEKFYAAVDCATGEIIEIEPAEVEKNTARLRLSLSPLQTMYIVASATKLSGGAKQHAGDFNPMALPPRSYRIIFKDQWEFESLTPNVLPLFNWNLRMGLRRDSGQISHAYETSFEAKEAAPGCMLIMDSMTHTTAPFQSIEITFNGVRMDDDPKNAPDPQRLEGYPAKIFGGKAQYFDLGAKVTRGMNHLTIRTTGNAIDPQTMLYPPMIAGNFAIVRGAQGLAIDKNPEFAGHDSWTKHGYPYMTGKARYTQTFEVPSDYDKLVLRFAKVSGTVYVKINDVDVGVLHWPPMELDVTQYCNAQRNRLSVEVVNTIDNVLKLSGRPSGLTGEVYIDVYKA